MKKEEFSDCLQEATRMFNCKPLSGYVEDVFRDEFGGLDKQVFLKAMAKAASRGCRFTPDNIAESLAVIVKENPKPRVKTDCTRCGGDGAMVINNFAYSCLCKASGNYPNYPKYSGEAKENLKITEHDDHIMREFDGYTFKVKKGANSVKGMTFEHELGLVYKSVKSENRLKKIEDFL